MNLGKSLIIFGIVLILIGIGFVYSDRLPFLKSLGRLPGDFSWRGDNWRVHFPLATSLLLSLLLTGFMWLLSWFQNRGGR